MALRPSLSLGWLRPAALALAGLSFSCSAIVQELTDRCNSNSDCRDQGEAYKDAVCLDGLCRSTKPPGPVDDGSPWGCLANLTFKPAPTDNATVFFRYVDPITDLPVPGVSVQSCGNIDPLCMNALAGPVVTDADGRAQLPFSTQNAAMGVTGFLGYFYLSGAGRMPHIYSVHPPMIQDRNSFFRVVTGPEIKNFAAIAGVTLNPERSLVIINSFDCQNQPTAKSTYSIIGADAETKFLYLSGGLPDPTSTQTDGSGTGFIANVEPGIITLEVVNLDAGRRIARTSITVRKDHVSMADIGPLPDTI